MEENKIQQRESLIAADEPITGFEFDGNVNAELAQEENDTLPNGGGENPPKPSRPVAAINRVNEADEVIAKTAKVIDANTPTTFTKVETSLASLGFFTP